MEDYETFCEKQLARIQEKLTQSEMSPRAQHEISRIQFHGIPVLSPLLSLERRKEMQQDKQKALDLEVCRQNSRKRVLLNRVQEILENVQMKKLSSPSDLDPVEMDSTRSSLEPKAFHVTQPSSVLSSSSACCGSTESQKPPEGMPADTQVVTNGNLGRGTEDFVPRKQMNPGSSPSEDKACPEGTVSSPVSTSPSKEATRNESVETASAAAEGPDPYAMSLQNLLKKSRDYIQREQTRRSLRNNSKRSISESHSDKENNIVKMSNFMREKGKLTGRSSVAAMLDKPSLVKSNTSPQSTSVLKNAMSAIASPSFSKVDIPMRSGTPPVLDSDSDEDFRTASLFDHDSSMLRSFTGSYSKLPSPEPSVSPQMHRRRPRPSSMGHIVINIPVNAYELSPKEKGRAVDLATQDAGDRRTASDPVPNLTPDLGTVCSNRVRAFCKNSSDTCDELAVGKQNQACPVSVSQQEDKALPANTIAEGELESRRPSSPRLLKPSLQELHAVGCLVLTQSTTNVDGAKQACLLDKTKRSAPLALNKSYDVESPSPLLVQTHPKQVETPGVSSGYEEVLENGLEKVKRRLELDPESLQKENMPYIATGGTHEKEKQGLHKQRCPLEPATTTKNETSDRSCSDEEALQHKMLAFKEMRKRLEEQHAQELSLLIAEQEREQERLHKEIEEQERRFKGEKSVEAGIEVPQSAVKNGMDLEWRKIGDSPMLGSVLSQVEMIHNAKLERAGFVNTPVSGSTTETPFYLWEPSASGKSISASRSISRNKMRWSQVYSLEMKKKLDKISALAKGFLTRRLLQTEKLKHLRQTVKDTMEFIKNFQSEAPLKRGKFSPQDASLQERVVAQLRAALYDIHDIFFKMEVSERMNILQHDRDVRKEKMLRQLDKAKMPRERVTLSTATQKSLDRKKYMKFAEMGIPHKKPVLKHRTSENRVLQPNQGQNAPIQRLLSRQGIPKTSVKGAEQNSKKPSESRVSNKTLLGVQNRRLNLIEPGKKRVYAGRIQRRKPSAVTT